MMYRSQFMAACILVLLTPVVALSTMTIGWGPNRVASVNNCTLGGNVMGGFRVSGHVMKRAPGVHQKAV